MDIVKKTSEYVLIAGLVLCATIYSTQTIVKRLPVRDIAWALTAVVLIILVTTRRIDFSILKRWIFPAFAGYLLFSVASFGKAVNFGEWFYDVSRTALMIIYLFLAVLVIKKDIARYVMLLAVVLGIYGLWCYPVTIMGNRNFWGQANFLMLVFCVYSIFNYKSFWRYASLVGGALACANIYFSRNKASWLACVMFVLAISIFYRKAFVVMALLIVVVVGLLLISPEKYGVMNSLIIRLEQWRETLIMTRDNFMVGAGNWKIAINNYAYDFKSCPEASKTLVYKSPHNDYLWVMAETSIFGLFFYLAIFALGLFYAYKSHNVFIFAGIVGYMTIAFFSFPRERDFHSMVLILLLALALKGYHIRSEYYIPKLFFCSVSLLVMGIVLVNFGIRYVSEVNCRRSRISSNNEPQKALEYLSNISILTTLDYYTTPYYFHRANLHDRLGNKKAALIDYERACAANPGYIYAQASLGRAYFYEGKISKAIECYKKALAIRPDYGLARENIRIIKDSI